MLRYYTLIKHNYISQWIKFSTIKPWCFEFSGEKKKFRAEEGQNITVKILIVNNFKIHTYSCSSTRVNVDVKASQYIFCHGTWANTKLNCASACSILSPSRRQKYALPSKWFCRKRKQIEKSTNTQSFIR